MFKINVPSSKYDRTPAAGLNQPVRPVDPTRRIGDQLINWFLRENPPADRADIIQGSLKPVDARRTNWIAKVMTTVHLPSQIKQHVSQVYFRTDGKNNIINNNVMFAI